MQNEPGGTCYEQWTILCKDDQANGMWCKVELKVYIIYRKED